MAPRANWKGYLRLSLVSCPIALYPASSLSEKVSFNRINRKTGNRLKQQNVDSETGEVVSRDDMVRGYEVAKDQYMIVEDEEIGAVQIESTRTIDIDQFVHCGLYRPSRVHDPGGSVRGGAFTWRNA
jgi:DNA end-binding protein Ku